MEILQIFNNHIVNQNPEIEYGCVCEQCGTIFIFKRSEASRPRCINTKPKDCYIKCPNQDCQKVITLDKCEEFKSDDDKRLFKQKHDY